MAGDKDGMYGGLIFTGLCAASHALRHFCRQKTAQNAHVRPVHCAFLCFSSCKLLKNPSASQALFH
jgi:hypothetical protein